MRFIKRSMNAEWARERLRHRFRVAIRKLDTEGTVRGGSANVPQDARGEVLVRSSCAVFSLDEFYCDVSFGLLR